jgi:predicted dehydrogenase
MPEVPSGLGFRSPVSARLMVPVGVLGLSPAWDTRYRPALQSLRGRIAVKAVYDPVPSRAELAAGEFGAKAVTGMRALAGRADLKALLVFDTGWCGAEALQLLCPSGRPMFVGGALGADEAVLDRLGQAAVSCGAMIMPELGQRYTPATCRLRELIATKLGRPVRIEIEADAPAVPRGGQPLGRQPWDEFVGRLADWCCYVIPTPPTDVAAESNGDGGPETIRLTFARPRAGGEPPQVAIRLRAGSSAPDGEASPPVYRVRCERGEAELATSNRITWLHEGDRRDESLAAERSDLQLMLDHFCRRVVGGLIPVADLEDVRRSRRLARAAADSLRLGSPVRLNGQA